MSDLSSEGKTLFYQALDQTPEKRKSFLEEECGDNTELLRLVELLLEAHEDLGTFFDDPSSRQRERELSTPTLTEPGASDNPDSISPTVVAHSDGQGSDSELLRSTSFEVDGGFPEIPGYRILKVIARGGMGIVYLAYQENLQRQVALKMLSAASPNQEQLVRFEREARAIARLQHPNIVQIYDVGAHKRKPYFSLELVEGGTLTSKLHESLPTPMATAQLLIDLAKAMHVAHQQGIVHRDLKPANILLTAEGEPKITDFGIAKQIDDVSHTRTGVVMGTPSYMSPEQATSKMEIGPASDIYSLGAILYECLTGRPPFVGANSLELVLRVTKEEPLPPRQLNQTTPKDLETICLKCLSKSAGQRYVTALEMAEDLERFLQGKAITARPVGAMEKLWRWCKRNPVVSSLLLSLFAVLMIGTAVSTLFAIRADQKAREAEQANGLAQRRLKGEQAAKQMAQQSEEREKKARTLAEKQQRLAETQLYANQLKLAEEHWALSQFSQATAYLEQSKKERRGWEHHYLRNRFYHQGQAALPTRQMQAIHCAAFSPNGNRGVLGTGSPPLSRGEATVWDVQSGRSLTTYEGHRQWVLAVAFHPNGKIIASGGWHPQRPGEIKLWDAETGQELRSLEGCALGARSLAFSPNGKLLVSAEGDGIGAGAVRIWDATTGKVVRSLEEIQCSVHSIGFSTNGKHIITGGGVSHPQKKLGVVQVWNVENGKEILNLQGHTDIVQSLAISPRGLWIASVSRDKTLRLWDAKTGKQALAIPLPDQQLQDVAFSANGKRVVASMGAPGSPGMVTIWNRETGKQIQSLKRHPATVRAVAIDPKGRWLLSGGEDRAWRLWDAQTGKLIRTVQGHLFGAMRAAFSPNGNRMVTVHGGGFFSIGEATVWDARTGEPIVTYLKHPKEISAAAFSPNNREIVSGGQDKTLRIWDAQTGEDLLALNGHAQSITDVAYSPNGRWIVSGGGDPHQPGAPGEVKIWSRETGREIRSLKGTDQWVASVAISPNGKRVAAGTGRPNIIVASKDKKNPAPRNPNPGRGKPGVVAIWDVDTGKQLLTIDPRQSELAGKLLKIIDVEFSPNGRTIAIALADTNLLGSSHPVLICDARTGKRLHILEGHTDAITSISFSPDGHSLVSSSEDLTIRMWDLRTGKTTRIYQGHTRIITCAAFSPDGQRIVSCSADETVRIWDAARGQKEQILEKRKVRFRQAAISPDGRQVALPVGPEIRIRDSGSGKEFFRLRGHSQTVESIDFSPNGKWLLSGSRDKTAKLWDLDARQEVVTFNQHRKAILAVAFSPNGKQAVTGSADQTVRVWSTTTGKEALVLKGHKKSVHSVSFSPDGRQVVSVGGPDLLERILKPFLKPSGGHELKVWDATTGEEMLDLEPKESVTEAVVSPNGLWLAIAGGGKEVVQKKAWGEIQIREAKSGRLVHTLRDPNSIVTAIAFAPDGRLLSGHGSGAIRVWDLQTGLELFSWKGHEKEITSIALVAVQKQFRTLGSVASLFHCMGLENQSWLGNQVTSVDAPPVWRAWSLKLKSIANSTCYWIGSTSNKDVGWRPGKR